FARGAFLVNERGARRIANDAAISLVDRDAASGAIVLGSDAGLTIVRADGTRTFVEREGPPAAPITALAAARDGALYAGSFDRGLTRFADERFRACPLADPRITALAEDADGRMWAGTARGAARQIAGTRFAPFVDPRGWLTGHINAVRAWGRTVYLAAYPG